MIQFLLMPVEVLYIYIIRERSGPKIDLSRTPQFISPAFESVDSKVVLKADIFFTSSLLT